MSPKPTVNSLQSVKYPYGSRLVILIETLHPEPLTVPWYASLLGFIIALLAEPYGNISTKPCSLEPPKPFRKYANKTLCKRYYRFYLLLLSVLTWHFGPLGQRLLVESAIVLRKTTGGIVPTAMCSRQQGLRWKQRQGLRSLGLKATKGL